MGFCVKLHPYLAEKCSDIIKLKIFENLRQSTSGVTNSKKSVLIEYEYPTVELE